MSNRRVLKNITAGILAVLFLALAGCDFPDAFFIKVAFIEGVPETGTAGTPLTLTANVRPAFASNKSIIWSIKDAGTTGAVINGNILIAAASGTVTIRAVIQDGTAQGKEYTQDFEIVFSVPKVITNIAIKTQPAKLEYFEGETLDLSGIAVTLTFDDSSTEDIGLAQFNAKGITASPAHGTALALAHNGLPVTITAGSHTANTNNLKVSERTTTVPVTGVSLNKTSMSLLVGGNETLTATITPTNATNKSVTWSSSAPTIATVNNSGLVTAVAAGSATITVTTTDGNKTAACSVTVQAPSNKEARIGTKYYDTLNEALNDAADGTTNAPTEIIILQDITAVQNSTNNYAYSIPAGKNIKLNVETGKNITITAAAGNFRLFEVSNTGSSLTLGPTTGGGTLTMSGGNATGQTNRCGVYVNGRILILNDGVTITGFRRTGGQGTGVSNINSATFTMNGGKISGNNSVGYDSGGVAVFSKSTFTMYDGEISDNISGSRGGGVFIFNTGSTFTMYDGKISGNTGEDGGGVCVYADCTFNMIGGTISDNTATNVGGGVYVYSATRGIFNMYGGKISANKAAVNGGGVYSYGNDYSSKLSFGKTAVINGNIKTSNSSANNVYLTDGKYITLGTGTNAPVSGMEIHVQTESADGVIVNSEGTEANKGYFVPDETGKMVVFEDGKLIIR